MAFTFIGAANGNNWTSSSTQDCGGALNVAAGDLLVAIIGYRSAGTISSVADTSAGNAMLVSDVTTQDVERLAMAYKISAEANSSSTFRVTYSEAVLNPTIIVFQFRPDSGETVTNDTGPSAASGLDDAPQTANFTTTGTDEVVVAGLAKHYHATAAAMLIADAAADGSQAGGDQFDAWGWYKIFTSAQSNIHAQETTAYANWVMMAMSFKSEAAGGETVFKPLMLLRG